MLTRENTVPFKVEVFAAVRQTRETTALLRAVAALLSTKVSTKQGERPLQGVVADERNDGIALKFSIESIVASDQMFYVLTADLWQARADVPPPPHVVQKRVRGATRQSVWQALEAMFTNPAVTTVEVEFTTTAPLPTIQVDPIVVGGRILEPAGIEYHGPPGPPPGLEAIRFYRRDGGDQRASAKYSLSEPWAADFWEQATSRALMYLSDSVRAAQ